MTNINPSDLLRLLDKNYASREAWRVWIYQWAGVTLAYSIETEMRVTTEQLRWRMFATCVAAITMRLENMK